MKRIITVLTILLIGLSSSEAQVFNCSSVCIQSVTYDTTTNLIDVSIINADSNQINYPVVVVVDGAGDTIANINAMFYLFAQLAGDTTTHELPTTLDSLPTNFTGTVYVTDAIYDTTCSYSFPMNCSTLSVADIHSDNNVSVYPNPATEYSIIDIANNNGKQAFVKLYDITGRELRTLSTTDKLIRIEREELSNGIYFVSINLNGKQFTKRIIFQ